jgi:subtilisin family serine protease
MKVAVTVGVLVLVMVIGGGPSTAAADDGRRFVDLQLRNGTCNLTGLVLQQISLIPGVQVLHVLSSICALGVQLNGNIGALVQALLRIPGVAVRYDPLGSLTLIDLISSLDPPYPPEHVDWGLDQIRVPHVHDAGWKGAGVTVAIVDTGFDLSHREFTNRIIPGFNAVAAEGGGCNGGPRAGAPYAHDNHGHGTHITGIIAAAVNGEGTIGAAPQVMVMPVKVLDHNAEGHLSDFICGLQWVYNQNVDLVNMSLGFWNDKVLLQRAIQRLFNKGVIMVAAAGNHGTSSDSSCVSGVEGGGVDDGGGDGAEQESVSCDPSSVDVMYPAKYQAWVLGVAASKYNDTKYPELTEITYYTRYGPEIAVVAPGGEQTGQRILSTRLGGGYGLLSGTSQATAHVTGATALALNKTPNLTFREVRKTLQDTAWDLVDYSGQLDYIKLINVPEFVE